VGLDLIGDRWTLLICRELAIGDQRFTDLRNALRGIAPNLLSERLRSLQGAGLVTSVELPPPAARTVYRLTDEGLKVRPVLRALARFGIDHLEGEPPDSYDARRAANSLLSAWRRSGGADQHVRLDLGHDVADLWASAHDTRIAGPEGEPDLVVHTSAAALVAARQGAPFEATFTGSAAARRRFLETFRLELAS
jgi:DNA-binding HxlR family transcriptional regulator